MASEPLLIVAESITPRLRHACRLVFEVLLGQPYRLATTDDGQRPCLHYSAQPPADGARWLQASGWLTSHSANAGAVPQGPEQGQFFPSSHPASLLPYDVLASVAWLGTLGPLRNPSPEQVDGHGRCTVHYAEPVAHHAAHALAQALGLPLEARTPSWELTLDVDQPWLHAHKGWAVQLGGFAMDLLLFRWGRARERWQSWRGKDSYEVYSHIIEKCPADKTTFFFLLNGSHRLDSRFTTENPHLQKLIRRLGKELGYGVGIHPSYLTSQTAGLAQSQLQSLEAVLGESVSRSRQHFLRYRTPQTFAELEKMGIRREYSLCPLQGTGFVNGFCVPFPWFDLEENRETEMWLVPSVVMDRGLLNAGLSPSEGAAQLADIRAKVRSVGGHFVPILHNETFSDHGVWRGWTSLWVELTDSLRNQGV